MAIRAYDIDGKRVSGVKVGVVMFKTMSNYMVLRGAPDIWATTVS